MVSGMRGRWLINTVEAYLTAYAAAIADRRGRSRHGVSVELTNGMAEFMHEERSILATHDARVTKLVGQLTYA